MGNKKTEQLGMNPSTASGRLVKDTLFRLAIETNHKCFQCGGELTRDTFSIEHKKPWLNSEDPLGNYFDQDNISFSHLSCNVKAAKAGRPKIHKDEASRLNADRESKRRSGNKVDVLTGLTKRQINYRRNGN